MAIEAIHLIGAGGHGRVVADALIASGIEESRLILRDRHPNLIELGRPVLTPEIVPEMAGAFFHIAVGSAAVRERLHGSALAAGARGFTAVHPAAIVARGAQIGDAAFVAATAVVAPGAAIGRGSIVNHGAIVDHDTVIGAFCHIAPNATLGGAVTIGDRVTIGAGATLLPGISVAADAVIGAGAVVIHSIDAAGTWVGNPARKLVK